MPAPKSLLSRGAIAGAIGAATLAAWFLAADVMRGAPLDTPELLARATGLGIAVYTILHFALFIAVGIVTAWLLSTIELRPHFLIGPILGILLFDLVFYAGVLIVGVDVVNELGWPRVLMGNIVAGIALLSYLQATAPAGTPAWGDGFARHRIVREGLIAGLIGATAVAAWFLVLDLVQGRLLFTPAALGSALFLGAGGLAEVEVTAAVVIAYTIVHLVGFAVIGLIAAAVVQGAQKEPPALLGAVLLFVTAEAFGIGLIAIVAEWLLDVVPWWSIAAANLVAAVAMGAYLWKAHPHLREDLRRADLEAPELTTRPSAQRERLVEQPDRS